MHRASRMGFALAAIAGFGSMVPVACGGANDEPPKKFTGGASGAGSAGKGGMGGSDASLGGTGGFGLEGGLDVFVSDVLTEATACTGTSASANIIPVNLYLMVDTSGSMSTDLPK